MPDPKEIAADLFSDPDDTETEDFYAEGHNEEVIDSSMYEEVDEPAPQEETDAPEEEQSEEPQKTEEPKKTEPAKPVDWEKRYKDLQSYHDVTKKTLETKLHEVESGAKLPIPKEEIEGLTALRDFMANDPEVMDFVQKRLAGGGTPKGTVQQPQIQYPQRPSDFDPLDVYDPSTPSGQWFAQVEAIKQQQMLSQVQNIVEQKTAQSSQTLLQQFEQRRIEEQRRQEQQRQVNEFWNRHTELSPQERDEFIAFVKQGPKTQVTMDHLYQLWRVMSDGSMQDTRRAPVDIESKIKNAQTAPPSMSSIPSGEEELSEDDMFSMSMIGYGKRNDRNNLI